MKILFVCLGNICRSPLGEGIMNDLSMKHNLGIICDSAGTSAYHIGDAPDHRSVQVAKNHSIDISKQKARQFQKEDFNKFDVIFAMDRFNHSTLSSIYSEHEHLYLMRDFDIDEPSLDVPDPYYGSLKDFENVYQIIYKSATFFVDNKLKQLK